MDAASIADFNALSKAPVVTQLAPAQIAFDDAPHRIVDVSFGEVAGQTALHPYGQQLDVTRTAALYFPLFPHQAGTQDPEFIPRPGQAFKVVACQTRPRLVDSRWQLGNFAAAALEATMKFTCERLTP